VVTQLNQIAVFCGSSIGTEDSYAATAAELGTTLADAGTGLVYGGGAVGLMGVVADACLAAGGEVVGVIPTGLFSREIGHTGLTQLFEVASMHERKQLMYEMADAFVALPGGLGTLEELAEVLTWNQLGILAKPVALLDIDGFWAPLTDWLTGAVEAGFVRAEHAASLRVVHRVDDVLGVLAAAEVPRLHKWLDLDES
jgi:uncharacterized protein (TIGR00730 family)